VIFLAASGSGKQKPHQLEAKKSLPCLQVEFKKCKKNLFGYEQVGAPTVPSAFIANSGE
jgi:hypothetical protein